MSPEIVAALVGIAGTVIGALLGVFKDDLRSRFSAAAASNTDLVGAWSAMWTIDGAEAAAPLQDSIHFKRVSGETIEGEGIFPDLGPYRVAGRLSPANLLTLTYEGIGTKRALGGVIILHLNGSRTEMDGLWIEYSDNRSFTRGSVRLRKARNA